MPLVDMPLSELEQYRGSNPRPDDFDAYWERGLAEMRSVPPEMEVRPANFRAPGVICFDFEWTGVGGARIYAKYLRPEGDRDREEAQATSRDTGNRDSAPALLVFHGYSGDSGDWIRYLPYAMGGFHVWAMDCRGQGGKSDDVGGVRGTTHKGHIIRGLGDDPDKLLFRQVFLDAAQLAGIAMATPGVDPKRVGATGGSQGGGLSLACAALEPRIARVAPVFPFLCDYRRVWEMDLGKRAYEEITDWFRRFDPRHQREDAVFQRLGYIDVAHLADRIRGHVRMTTGLMDEVCPPSTQFAAFNAITAPKEMVLYPDFGHENLPGNDDDVYTFMAAMRGA